MTTAPTICAIAIMVVLALSSPLVAGPVAAPDIFTIDPTQSAVRFQVTKWGVVAVSGRFLDFDGTLVWDPARPEQASTEWRVRVASVTTGEPDRDRALAAREYFHAAAHPELRFVSTRVRRIAPARLEVEGAITLRGATRALTLAVDLLGERAAPHGRRHLVFSTAFRLNRRDFGIVGGALLGPVISDEVRVELIAAARRASALPDR